MEGGAGMMGMGGVGGVGGVVYVDNMDIWYFIFEY